MPLTVLGLSGSLSHDPSAALYIDGRLVAAAEEERFIRDKHARGRMPFEAAKFCLDFAGIRPADVDAVAIPFAPISLMEPARWHYAKRYWYAPDRALDAIFNGNRRYRRYRGRMLDCLAQLGFDPAKVDLVPVEHHLTHASSAYHCSGFTEKTAILGIDGKGEYATTFFGYGENGRIHKIKEFYDPDSLGGLYGVLRGNPFAFREHIFIWPTTFFLFILSAAAVGPSFVLLTTWLVGKVSRKRLVSPEVFHTLAKISGTLLLVYVVLKGIDSLVWINATSPKTGVQVSSFYAHPPFGTWILFAEVVLLGLVPAVLLLSRRVRARTGLLVLAAVMACAGVVLNRYVMTIQTLALPSLPFDSFLSYSPSWQETAAFLAVLGYGVLLYSISFRWLNLFPEERELAAKG